MNLNYQKLAFVLLLMVAFTACKGTKKMAYTPAGTWEYLIAGLPDGDQEGMMTLTQSGDKMIGKIESDMGAIDLEDVAIEGNALTSSFSVQGYEVSMKGNFEGETFKGNIEVGGYEFPITATRKL